MKSEFQALLRKQKNFLLSQQQKIMAQHREIMSQQREALTQEGEISAQLMTQEDDILAQQEKIEADLMRVTTMIKNHNDVIESPEGTIESREGTSSAASLTLMRRRRVRGVLKIASKVVQEFAEPFNKDDLRKEMVRLEPALLGKISDTNIRNTLRLLMKRGAITLESKAIGQNRATYVKAA